MAERESGDDGGGSNNKNDGSSRGNAARKSESRFGQSPLNNSGKEMKQKKAITSESKANLPGVRIYQPPKPSSPQKMASRDEEEESSGSVADEPPCKVGVLAGGRNRSIGKRKSNVSLKTPPNVKEDKFVLTVETIMTAAKPLSITVTKNYTIANIRQAIKSKMKAKHFGIYVNNKELGPEDSTLEANGIVSDTKVRIHIKTQSGSSDKEDINSLIRITKSMNDLKNILSSMNSASRGPKKEVKNKPRPKEAIEPEKKAEEDQKSREKMAKIREKISQRNSKPQEAKVKGKKKNRKDGGIAGQYPLPANPSTNASISTSDSSNNSVDESSEQENNKSNVSEGSISNELFDPPDSKTKWEEIANEFKTARCGRCRMKLPLILREMPCRCGKVYCQNHRLPTKHSCAVDLKKLDRIKLEKELPKSVPVSRKNSDEDLDETPKSSNKKLH